MREREREDKGAVRGSAPSVAVAPQVEGSSRLGSPPHILKTWIKDSFCILGESKRS